MKAENLKKLKKQLLLFGLVSNIALNGCNNTKINDINEVSLNDSNIDYSRNDSNIDYSRNDSNIDYSRTKGLDELNLPILENKYFNNKIIKYRKMYGFVNKKTTYLRNDVSLDSKKIKKLYKYDKVKILKKINESSYYINYEGKKGYVRKDYIKKLPKEFIDVDLSRQKLKLYKKGKVKLKTSVVTGLNYDNNRKTPKGMFKILYKEKNRTLKGPNYSSFVQRWMPFYKGYGLHDAYWRSSFGGEIYKSNGSHGCVNMPTEKAKELYEKVDSGTKVLIHR